MVAQLSPPFSVPSLRPAVVRAAGTAESREEALLDAALVRRFNAGDQTAFVDIVTRYRARMFALAFRHLRNHADAEEVAQDTFVRAYHGLARFRGDSSLASWLHRIAFNLSCNRYWHSLRRHHRDTHALDAAPGDDRQATFADLIASDLPDPARAETNREFFAHVTVCMAKLSVRQREILTLRSLLDRSYEEIAETLELTPGTVKSRLARARQSLRGLLAETYADFAPAAPRTAQWLEPGRPAGHLNAAHG